MRVLRRAMSRDVAGGTDRPGDARVEFARAVPVGLLKGDGPVGGALAQLGDLVGGVLGGSSGLLSERPSSPYGKR